MDRLKARRLALFALSVGGYFFLAYVLWWGFSTGRFPAPGGDALTWDRAGDQIRDGINPFERVVEDPTSSFWYLPPFGVIFAVASILPPMALWLGIVGLELVALRSLAGSWRNAGFAGWFPLVGFELVSGNFNLVVAASIVAAVHGRPGAATTMSFAKLSPILAAHPRDWRQVLAAASVMFAITLPALWLWAPWFAGITEAYGQPLGPQIPIPFPVRVVIAAALLLVWRPWSRALAAVVAIPAFYWGSFVLLLAPIAVVLRGVRAEGR